MVEPLLMATCLSSPSRASKELKPIRLGSVRILRLWGRQWQLFAERWRASQHSEPQFFPNPKLASERGRSAAMYKLRTQAAGPRQASLTRRLLKNSQREIGTMLGVMHKRLCCGLKPPKSISDTSACGAN